MFRFGDVSTLPCQSGNDLICPNHRVKVTAETARRGRCIIEHGRIGMFYKHIPPLQCRNSTDAEPALMAEARIWQIRVFCQEERFARHAGHCGLSEPATIRFNGTLAGEAKFFATYPGIRRDLLPVWHGKRLRNAKRSTAVDVHCHC